MNENLLSENIDCDDIAMANGGTKYRDGALLVFEEVGCHPVVYAPTVLPCRIKLSF